MLTGKGLPIVERNAAALRLAALRFTTVLKGLVLALALTLSCPAFAAGFQCAKPAEAGTKGVIQELDEVVVTGEKIKTRSRDLREWLKLLVGKYTYEGYVDLCGQENARDLRPVTGTAACVASGENPNVHCTVNVRWPAARGENGAPVLGGVSSLAPAFAIYSLENRYQPEKHTYQLGLVFTQVDNKGIAEWASGTLVGDTFTSNEPCVGIPGACRKVTKITARPKSKQITTQVDVEIDNRRVLHQSFVLNRELSVGKDERYPGSSP
jgi:hypothetical protein